MAKWKIREVGQTNYVTLDVNPSSYDRNTRVYVNNVLCVDTSAGVADTPVVSYQINRSRKLGAGKLSLNVANPGGIYSYKRKDDPVFGYGKKIMLQEGITVGLTMEWFTRFTGIIVSQVPSIIGGKPSLARFFLFSARRQYSPQPDSQNKWQKV